MRFIILFQRLHNKYIYLRNQIFPSFKEILRRLYLASSSTLALSASSVTALSDPFLLYTSFGYKRLGLQLFTYYVQPALILVPRKGRSVRLAKFPHCVKG